MKKQSWIYQIRGIAIIAVVVCHQQRILHESEVIQLLSLYSVTTLIFLMGVTKALSLKSHYQSCDQPEKIFTYSLKSMAPTLCAYIVATFFYSYEVVGWDYNIILSNILSFSASPPFYFIRHYILLSLWAPLLYSIIKLVFTQFIKYEKMIMIIVVYYFIWMIGYVSIGRMDIFGQSYFFVYALGLLIGQINISRPKKIYFVPAIIVLLLGLFSTKNFYWARVEGVYDYAKGIDFLCPKLQMNPPNISIIVYSFGVISVSYLFFELTKDKGKGLNLIGKLFYEIGKYSLDIFLWHSYIQNFLNRYFSQTNHLILKWIIYYFSMFAIPIFTRYVYSKVKAKMYEVLTDRFNII